jgi:hypothetical protein
MRAFILTGSRNWTDVAVIETLLGRALEVDAIMIHGAHNCPPGDLSHDFPPTISADAIADHFYRTHGGRVIRMHAEWHRYGRSAGHIRNVSMLHALIGLRSCSHIVSVESFALAGGIGTFDMCRISREANVDVRDHGVVTS